MKRPASISGSTKIVGIFGDPIGHTRSPAMHNAAFEKLGLDYRYVPFRVAPAQLGAAARSIRALGLVGVNVTVPHKEKIRRHLDSESTLATALGAVNTVVNDNGHLHGENTDLDGFARSLSGRRLRLRGGKVVVIGAGGASRAVLAGLEQLGVGEVVLANRTRARSRRLVRELEGHIPSTRLVGLEELADQQTLADCALVVNATTLGWGRDRFPSLAITATRPRCLFYDMAYALDTAFLRAAKRAKRPTMDGGEMLVLQSARSFSLWTKRAAPVAAMRIAFNNKS